MKKINDMALEVAEVTLQLMKDTTDWVLADHSTSGDEYNAIHASVMQLAINKMYMQTKHDNESII
jgi:hypothetical protein